MAKQLNVSLNIEEGCRLPAHLSRPAAAAAPAERLLQRLGCGSSPAGGRDVLGPEQSSMVVGERDGMKRWKRAGPESPVSGPGPVF